MEDLLGLDTMELGAALGDGIWTLILGWDVQRMRVCRR